MSRRKAIDWRIVITGIVGLTAIEIVALFNGIDGKLMSIVIGIIALAIGVVIPNPINK